MNMMLYEYDECLYCPENTTLHDFICQFTTCKQKTCDKPFYHYFRVFNNFINKKIVNTIYMTFIHSINVDPSDLSYTRAYNANIHNTC